MALLGELRRRNIFKVSLAYMILSWLTVQIADILLPLFGAPLWIMQVLVLLLILAFPIAMLLAWAFELTPDGLKATADVDKTQSITLQTGRRLNRIVFALLSVAGVFLIIDNYVFPDKISPAATFDYRQTLAVMPFVIDHQKSEDTASEDMQLLAAGIHTGLYDRLKTLQGLRVAPRSSVLRYRDTRTDLQQISAELDAGSVLEADISFTSDTIQIAVRLIDSRTNESIWTDSYDRDLSATEVFAIQSEMATAVADELDVELSEAEQQLIDAIPTRSLTSLAAYFAGEQSLTHHDPQSLRAAIENFSRSVSADPQFASAWTGLAESWLQLANVDGATDAMQVRMEATAAANRAIALNPQSADAAAVLGWHKLLHNQDWGGAEEYFLRALDFDATNVKTLQWYSQMLSFQAKHYDAIAKARLAVASHPHSAYAQINLSNILANAQQWDEAFVIAEALISTDLDAALLSHLWTAKIQVRRALDAAVHLERWASATGRDIAAATELGRLIVRAQSGEEIEGDNDASVSALIERLEIVAEVPIIYASFGDADKTIQALQAAHLTGNGLLSVLSMRINPSYDFIREDPRFIALLNEIGL